MYKSSLLHHDASATAAASDVTVASSENDSSTGAATVAGGSLGDSSTLVTRFTDQASTSTTGSTDQSISVSSSRHVRSRQELSLLEEQHVIDSDEEDDGSAVLHHEYLPGAFALAPGQTPEGRQAKGQLTSMPVPERQAIPPVVHREFDPSRTTTSSANADGSTANYTIDVIDDTTSGYESKDNSPKTRRGRMLIYLLISLLVVAICVGVAVGIGKSANGPKATGYSDPSSAPTVDPLRPKLIERLSKFTTNSSVWNDPESPQQKAITWLAEIDRQWQDGEEETGGNARLESRYALAVLYFATNGPNWFHDCDFLNPETHECTWNIYSDPSKESWHPQEMLSNHPQPLCGGPELSSCSGNDIVMDGSEGNGYGVVCSYYDYGGLGDGSEHSNNSSSPAVVVAILLGQNSLSGGLPHELIALSDLQILDLSDNSVEGTRLPPATIQYLEDESNESSQKSILLLWPDLRHLNLHGNQLVGPLLLEEYGHWTQLETLRLGCNQFQSNLPQGTLPWSQLSQLKILDLQVNILSGNLPSTIGLLSQLSCLDLRDNKFSGTLPVNWVQSNDLPFATNDQALSFGNTTSSLYYLGISNNFLTGSIPTLISSSLVRFDAGYNRFSGIIPVPPLSDWMDGINNPDDRPLPLEWLLLGTNSMTGTIPLVDMAFLDLKNVDLRKNRFTGTIGEEIGDVQQSQQFVSFYADNNVLSGTIPTTIGRLTNMKIFTLGHNGFTGTLPSEVGTMYDLNTLDLQNNALSGVIPSELSFLENIERLYFQENFFTGDLDFLCVDEFSIQNLDADCVDKVQCSCCKCF